MRVVWWSSAASQGETATVKHWSAICKLLRKRKQPTNQPKKTNKQQQQQQQQQQQTRFKFNFF